MPLRDVAGQDGGVRENYVAEPARIFPGYTTEGTLDAARECREQWNVLSTLHMCLPSRRGPKCLDTVITGV